MKMFIEENTMEEVGELVLNNLLISLCLFLLFLIGIDTWYINGSLLYKSHYMAYYTTGFIVYFAITSEMAKNSIKRKINHEINIEGHTNFNGYKGITPGTDWQNHELLQNGNKGLARLAFDICQDKEVEKNKETFWHLRKVFKFLKVPMLESFESKHIISRYALLEILSDAGYNVFGKGLDSPAFINGKKDLQHTWLFESFLSEWVNRHARRLHNNFIFACNNLLAGKYGTQLVAIGFISNLLDTMDRFTVSEEVKKRLIAIEKTILQHEEFLRAIHDAGLFKEFKKESRWLNMLSAQIINNQVYKSCQLFFRQDSVEQKKNNLREWVREHTPDTNKNMGANTNMRDINYEKIRKELLKYLSYMG